MGDYTKLITTTGMYGCYSKEELFNLKTNIENNPSSVTDYLVGVGTGIVGVATAGVLSFLAFSASTAWATVSFCLTHSNASRIVDELEDELIRMDHDQYAFVGIECKCTYSVRDLRDGTCSAIEPLRVKIIQHLGEDYMSKSKIKNYIKVHEV